MIGLTVLCTSLTLMAFIVASALAEPKADRVETELRASSFIDRNVRSDSALVFVRANFIKSQLPESDFTRPILIAHHNLPMPGDNE
jgi:hypothetical protein